MTTGAWLMMLVWCGSVTLVTGYFLYRVLTTKKKREPDSYSGNDNNDLAR